LTDEEYAEFVERQVAESARRVPCKIPES